MLRKEEGTSPVSSCQRLSGCSTRVHVAKILKESSRSGPSMSLALSSPNHDNAAFRTGLSLVRQRLTH